MKDYQKFKEVLLLAQLQLDREGKHIEFRRWRKESPYQKARYKPEHVYPEVWAYRGEGGLGMVITGEDIKNKGALDVASFIESGLY